MAGYSYFEGMSFPDAYVNAAIVLTAWSRCGQSPLPARPLLALMQSSLGWLLQSPLHLFSLRFFIACCTTFMWRQGKMIRSKFDQINAIVAIFPAADLTSQRIEI